MFYHFAPVVQIYFKILKQMIRNDFPVWELFISFRPAAVGCSISHSSGEYCKLAPATAPADEFLGSAELSTASDVKQKKSALECPAIYLAMNNHQPDVLTGFFSCRFDGSADKCECCRRKEARPATAAGGSGLHCRETWAQIPRFSFANSLSWLN